MDSLVFANGLGWVAFALLLITGAVVAAFCALPGLLAGGAAVWHYQSRQGGHVAKERAKRL